jgi:hypothetical protein
MSADVRPANPADKGVEAAAYICERCEEETASAYAWDDEAKHVYTASGEVVRGEWYPICHECAHEAQTRHDYGGQA